MKNEIKIPIPIIPIPAIRHLTDCMEELHSLLIYTQVNFFEYSFHFPEEKLNYFVKILALLKNKFNQCINAFNSYHCYNPNFNRHFPEKVTWILGTIQFIKTQFDLLDIIKLSLMAQAEKLKNPGLNPLHLFHRVLESNET